MRGQLLQQVQSRCGISAAMNRHARCGFLVTVVAMGLAGVTGAGAQQASPAPFAQSAVATSATPTTTVAVPQPAAASEPATEAAGQTPAQSTAMQPGAGPRRLDAFIGIQSGTLGFGVQAAKLIIGHLGVRAGFNFFNFGVNNTVSDVKYSARLRFQNLPVMVDIFPWSRGAFHVTGGVVFDQNRITGTGQSDAAGNITINHDTYTQAQIGVLSGAVRYPSTAGYAGIGFGTPARNSLITFTTDIGVMISTPKVSLSATGAGSNPQLQSDLQAQQASTQTDINKYAKIYPVISAGLAVRI
jgi:hypothetical protein